MSIDFITTNTAVDAFRKGMESAAKQRMDQVREDQARQQLDESTQGQPFKVSRLKSDSRIASTAADVAEANKGADIRIRYNTADSGDIANQSATVDLGVNRATAPSKIRSVTATNDATTEQAPLGTEQKRSDVRERVTTSPYRVQQEKDQASISGVNAQDAQLKFIKESVKLIEEGRLEEADELARRRNDTIPEAIRTNAATRAVLAQSIKDAEMLHPNRPADQLKYIRTKTDEAVQSGVTSQTPQDRFKAVPGLPAPQETSATKNTTALMQNTDFLIQRGVAKDTADAVRQLNSSKTDPTQLLKDLYAAEYKIRTDAAKGPGGMGNLDNKALETADREAMQAAQNKLKLIKDTAASLGNVPLPTGASALNGAAPPPAAAAPAPPPVVEKPKPAWYEFWKKGQESAAVGGGVVDGRTLQQPAAAPMPQGTVEGKAQDRVSAVKATPPEVARQAARDAISKGAPRDAVILRLQQSGIDTTGL